MKRLCKDVDITDRGLISRAVYACLNKKYKRNDVVKYLSDISGIKEKYIRIIHYRYGKPALYPFVEIAISELQSEIINENISFPPIWYKEKVDGSSGKIRRIGIQNIKQQLYDYIAVEALAPLLKRIGEYQYASIPGRGTTKGKDVISKWIRNKDMRYFVKLDVRKCFESIDHGKLMDFLQKRIKNSKLIWLVGILTDSFEAGLSIGSYLSQYLCNIYMSIPYHYIMENMYKIKRGKKINLIRHCMIYMDDILLIGTRKRDMEKAIKLLNQKIGSMGLVLKQNYQIRRIGGNNIDMLGFKIFRTHTEIRGRIFLRIRRAFRKAKRCITIRTAKKCISYFGFIKNSNSQRISKRWKVLQTIKKCKETIRNESKVFRTAVASQSYPA